MNRRRMIATGMMGGNPFAYRKSWLHTIYVSTTGNDTTGNGSKATPYLTLTKAFTVAVAGDGILIANGTYAEGAAGSYWTISKNLANWLTIEPELGQTGDVTITGNGNATYNTYFASATQSHMRFKWIKFGMSEGSAQALRITGTVSYLEFIGCAVVSVSGATEGIYISAGALTNSLLSFCTVLAPASNSFLGVRVSIAAGYDLTINNSNLSGSANFAGGKGLYVTGALGGSIAVNNTTMTAGMPSSVPTGGTVTYTNCTFVGDEVIAGADGTGDGNQAAALATVKYINCTVIKINTTGHALILGYGCTQSLVDNVTIPSAYDYALVLKEHTGTEVRNCHLTGGSSSALLYKAVIGVNCHDNVLVGTGTSGAFQLRNGDSGNKCQNWILQTNAINVSSGKALQIGNDTHDAGGGVCDYNTYQNSSGLGIVRNDANVANLTELQAAWADYDVTTNDVHSTVV